MTKHYSIEIISKKLFFKATYRNGKFRKIEHLRGKLNRELMDSLGRVIPVDENEVQVLNKLWFQRVNYQVEVKEVSLYTKFLNEWCVFYENLTNIPPKITGADTNALKSIITYLKRINNSNETETLTTWKQLLDSWNELNQFHQQNTDLKYINSKLNVIIREIIKNNGASTTRTGRSVSI